MRLDRVDSRKRLEVRREPHWQRLAEGRHLGYRCMTKGVAGSWIARAAVDGRYRQKPLGSFDSLDPGLRFDAAKEAAEAWFGHLNKGGSVERVTVKQACEAYVTKLRTERSESSAADAEGTFRRFVDADPIAAVELAKLTPRHVTDWRARIVKGRSKAYSNRVMTALRAALNLAHALHDVASDHAWRTELKALDAPSGQRTLYLDRNQRRALIDAASDELRPLLKALCLLPLRVGELVQCQVKDFDAAHGVLRVPDGKTGGRDVPLSREAIAHFKECSRDKTPAAWLISRTDGRQWDRFAWRDEIKLAAAGAKLPRATTVYTLRHSVITDLVTGGLDLFTVGQVSGTSVRMIELHYGKLRAQVARKALDKLAL